MARSPPGLPGPLDVRGAGPALAGASVPVAPRGSRRPSIMTPASRKAVRQRMLLLRQSSVDHVGALTGASDSDLKRFRHDLLSSDVPDALLDRGVSLPFTRELPQGALLYLLVRALRPHSVVETGVRPGYSTAWLLAGLDANGAGELTSIGPGTSAGRVVGTAEMTVGQFVAPSLRGRWTLVLGNAEERLREVLEGRRVDLFLCDNAIDAHRARVELHTAWPSLAAGGLMLAHHVDASPAWAEFCQAQGLAPQLLDPGPPPMGALAVDRGVGLSRS
ncbi:MAG: class I SAM-dependent methyltransferase [Thermoplasmata archaeon]|nr:class I SAM-dependent methyltransferase [Thermoplasmata archaeon]